MNRTSHFLSRAARSSERGLHLAVAATVLGLGACSAGPMAHDHEAEQVHASQAELNVTVPNALGEVTVVVPPETAPVQGPLAGWRPVPGLSGAIQSAEGASLTVTVTAEMFGNAGARLRAKVNGVVSAVTPLFMAAGQGHDDVRSFTFVMPSVHAGQHVVEIEWLSATPNVAPQMRDRSLTMHSATSASGQGRLAVNQSATVSTVSASAYTLVPGSNVAITTAQAGPLAITFASDADVAQGRLFVQAVVDGAVVSDVLLAEAGASTHRAARSYTFVSAPVVAGNHTVELRALAENGAATLYGQTVSVASAPETSAQGGMVARGVQTAPTSFTSTGYVDVPFLTTTFSTSAAASTAIIEAGGESLVQGGRLFLRALVDGVPVQPTNVTFLQGEAKFRAQSFAFATDNLPPGLHEVRVQAAVDGSTSAAIGDRFVRVHHARRSGAAFVQPYNAMRPKFGVFETLVICFDPLRPGEQRPTKAQIQNMFEGSDGGKSTRGWWAENSGQRFRAGTVTYLGCDDGNWFVAPPGRQGNYYWDNGAFELMWQDALRAADPFFDFHARDTDKNGRVDPNELLVAIVRPQNSPYGTTRGTSVSLDGQSTALGVHLSDLYLSALPENRTWSVGTISHEFSHSLQGAQDIYSPCPPETNAGSFSIMSWHGDATHLDPWHKLKSGLVRPDAIEITSWTTKTLALPPVERGPNEVTVLYDPSRLDREYFVIENRVGSDTATIYDQPLGNNVVVWHVIEDAATRNAYPFPATNTGCRIPVRFLKTLSSVGSSYDLTWADGTPARIRITLKSAVGAPTNVEIAKLACVDDPLATTCAGKQCGPAVNNCGHAVSCPNTCTGSTACGAGGAGPNQCGCVSTGDPCGSRCSGQMVDNCGNVYTCHESCGLDGECPLSGGTCSSISHTCLCRTGPAF